LGSKARSPAAAALHPACEGYCDILPVRDGGGARGPAVKAGCRRGVSNDVRRFIADFSPRNMSRNSRHSGSGFEINSSQISKCIRLNFQFVTPDKR